MGEFTALDHPLVDQTIEAHLQQIIAAVRSRMEPQSIILRGSFGRGEGSVVIQDGQLRFLSDYEIDVETFSPFYRSLFAELSQELTTELGVETGLRWVRPGFMRVRRVGPLPMRPGPITISLYESTYGSHTLFGEDVLHASLAVDPRQISLTSGITLVLNRMAESQSYMRNATDAAHDELESFFWVNKTILACSESLLLLWGQYHLSYEERGRRFAAMADDRLGFMHDQAVMLSEFVARATEFKLRPRHGLYREPVQETWLQVVPICDTVFRHLTEQVLGFCFGHYVEFPELFLQYATDRSKFSSPLRFATVKLLDMYKYLRTRRLPRGLLLPFDVSRVVYAVVPLLFVAWAASDEILRILLGEARRQLRVICPLDPPEPDPRKECDALRQQMLWAWKVFCY
jgi:hypothetical protein